ncbi:MAG: carbamate kinase [Streptosporangiales bacterium]|nr:carbamate kinase [Streptosporangiales bacterium]
MRVLVALGGNAMTAPDGSARPGDQIAAATVAMERVADLVAAGHDVALTHGNGPQVGNLLVKNELAAEVVPPVPLDWCGAQTQGTLGFVLLDALQYALAERRVERPVAALVTRTRVDRDDPGLRRPSKPIGRYLSAAEAQTMIEHGQTWEDRGMRGWRRIVASPEPREVLDSAAARVLMDAGHVVVVGGGGGIPVVRDPDGSLRGVEAVIDKDLTADLLARDLAADVLVVATDVEHVLVGYGTQDERPVRHTTPAELRTLADKGEFASGSMGPKVEAVCRFVEAGGTRAVITSLAHIGDAVTADAGTVVQAHPEGGPAIRKDPV